MPDAAALLAWSEGDNRLLPVSSASHGPVSHRVDVADSWLVDDGMVRGLRYHAERFVASCQLRHGVDAAVTTRFLAAACLAWPRAGRWFPRVEFEAGSGFRLRLRPAPAPGAGVVLRRAGGPDRRRTPLVKGPDLEMLAGLRQSVAALGADEVLLVSGTGHVLEGALSALLWWRGDVLCAPPLSLPILPSVTRRLLLEIAAEAGTDVRLEVCLPEELDGLELWTASALHGIRPVISWSGESMTAAPARRAAAGQARLLARARPVAETLQVTGSTTAGGS